MINQNNHVIENVKVYFDGSHFIAILPGFYKGKKKGKNKEYLVEDIACPYGYSEGHEDFEGKAVLFDNFLCLKNGEVLGTVSLDIIQKLEDYE